MNWKKPTSFQISKVNTPTFTANEGFDFNGTTQYLNTTWIPSTNGVNYTLNNASYGCHVNDNVTSGGLNSGVDMGSGTTYLISRNSAGELRTRLNDAVNLNSTNASSIGFYQAQRISSSSRSNFKNGISVTAAAASVSLTSDSFFIGAQNSAGTPAAFSSREISMAFAGSSMQGLERTLYTHWNNYFTTL